MTDATPTDPIVQTEAGQLRGRAHGNIVRYLGIAYAAPPRRFELPQPVAAWDGVRDALDPGPTAPHMIRAFPAIDIVPLVGSGSDGGDGDYLRVNIWAPKDAKRAPVMVFIHGGGFVVGSKDAPVSDGSEFARSGVMCVAINYRLGIDGFLPVPGVPTNLGLRDMIFALGWVQRNIAAFGGDPANVTVFGESAGAMAIADLVTSPLAKGLFARAIVESGHGAMVRDIAVAQRLVKKLAKLLKVSPDADGFRSVSHEAATAAIEKLGKPWAIDLRDAGGREPVYGISRFIPVYGDDVLPEKPHDALRSGAGAEVEVLIGSNAEEMNLYFVPTGVRAKIGGLFARWLLGRSMPDAKGALLAYGYKQKGVRPGAALTDAMNDLVFRWPARQYAAAHRGKTWMYEFDWRSPACGGELGACHGIELPFVFKTLASAAGPKGLAGEAPPQELAERVHKIWVGFARDGSLPWAEFGGDRQIYQLERGEAVHEPVMPAAAFVPE
ncbi:MULTISPECIES: carboxylesterase/lipase family protein [unclassified Sphingopyxis]|uniref:carboxylesterase/lipase family protein n=1 Tax=unclassified Sphingopyxis TaxID=2614943 RepID=UPI0007363E46|nr:MULTISPECIES: carboxylesterase family protein [unclassified Sphingopyxis]KTE41100.1 carboxylesterase [Sphingopyxis sp. HIX]KTE84260.1 carboxylesterase [Sphingopyxis sp. HXXIV]